MKLRGKVKAALTYPVVVLCIAVLAVIGMLLFIVPTFASLFTTLGGTLPFPTRVLVFLSGALKVAIVPLVVVVFALLLPMLLALGAALSWLLIRNPLREA